MTGMIVGDSIAARQRALMRWYAKCGRQMLPWRHRITPYRVLVSEIMLQQTQVERVIPYFTVWMRRWPTVEHLARAKRSDVIRAWAGLGYNRRAVYLHRAAQEIVKEGWFDSDFSPSNLEGETKRGWSSRTNGMHTGNIRSRYPLQLPLSERGRAGRAGTRPRPYDMEELAQRLRRLPGVGSYTANAILAFAWNLPAPCVDVNVRRVLAYAIYRHPAIMRMPLAQVERLAARVIPREQGRAWNSALMDYGALVLNAKDVPRRIARNPRRAHSLIHPLLARPHRRGAAW